MTKYPNEVAMQWKVYLTSEWYWLVFMAGRGLYVPPARDAVTNHLTRRGFK